ncbi:hypothetical protein KFE25_011346 [Diacronema lutheri]|uniref:Uncharacterized protein n=1 Tax=Diacronema lutheri TaxID=2081491 RepID=A0A8J5X4A6_DIALT|nr:hypothetical protein KFE25_011346 [Diacronema lutheri]
MRLAVVAALAITGGAEALSWPMSGASRIYRGVAASSARYRLHRQPDASSGAPPSSSDGSATRLLAVQSAAEASAPELLSRNFVAAARQLVARIVADVAALHSWRRMASTVFVAVLVVAWREGLRKGMATNPFQIALMGMCVLLEVIHLAEPDGTPSSPAR